MIRGAEALKLAAPTAEDIELARAALKKIDQHIRNKMTFAGPEILELRTDELSFAAAKLVAVAMKGLDWNVNASLGMKQGKLGGSTTLWQLSFSPTIEVYESAVAELNLGTSVHLDA